MSNTHTTIEQAVLAAAGSLVTAFSRHDTQAYFDAFAPDASFIFHTHATVLATRAAYEQLWRDWEEDLGFRVVSCTSCDPVVQVLGEVAVFHHRAQTVLSTHDGETTLDERETIVFQRNAHGHWLAVHEHLSPQLAAPEVGAA